MTFKKVLTLTCKPENGLTVDILSAHKLWSILNLNEALLLFGEKRLNQILKNVLRPLSIYLLNISYYVQYLLFRSVD